MKISVILPVLNEAAILEAACRDLRARVGEMEQRSSGTWEVIVVDAGSNDGSATLGAALAGSFGWEFVGARLPVPSVGRTVRLGVEKATGEIAIVVPCDASLAPRALPLFYEAVAHGGKTCGGFEKSYEPSTRLLRAYARAQNFLRSRLARHLVWTNGMFFQLPTDRRDLVPTGGFLEDIVLSDRLRRREGWILIGASLRCSARRYYPNRIVKRILVNFAILSLYRLGLSDPDRLRRLYTSLK